MDNIELSQFYSTFSICQEGIHPNIKLPRDYREIMPKFWRQKRENNVENYLSNLKDLMKDNPRFPEILLQWELERGLTSIAIGTQGGLDLEDLFVQPHFKPHNLGGIDGIYGAMVAMEYVSELTKANTK